MPGAGYYVPHGRGLEESARARAAHRRRRVRLRRDARPARRRGHRGALRRLLDRDALAPGGLSARHAGTGGPRGDGRARHPRVGASSSTTSRCGLPRAPPGDPRAADRPLGRLEARRRAPAQPARHPPGPPGRRRRGLRAFKRTTILGYEIPWNNFDFGYQAYVALEQGHLERKVAALAKYGSQQHRRYSDPEYVWNLARGTASTSTESTPRCSRSIASSPSRRSVARRAAARSTRATDGERSRR